MKLRFAGPLPEDEEEVDRQIAEHMKFMMELKEKEKDKDFTIDLAEEILKKCHPDAVQVIKHWITIIQSRWDEVASWALFRDKKDLRITRDNFKSCWLFLMNLCNGSLAKNRRWYNWNRNHFLMIWRSSVN